METDTNSRNGQEERQANRRFRLALYIIGPSLVILITVSGFMLQYDKIKADTVFTALIGLIGTWVGTILAFYYSKDNFEAASRSTDRLIDKVTSSQDKLKSTIAKDVMLLVNEFNRYDLLKAENQILLQEVKEAFKGYNRLPVLSQDGVPKYILHESLLNLFITDFFMGKYDGNLTKDASTRNTDFPKLTFDKFLQIDTISIKVKSGFVIARQDDNLASIKRKMDAVKNTLCSDVFITTDGTVNGKLIGWLTNAIILEHSKV